MAALGEVLAAGALVQGERVLTGVALKGTVAQAAEKVAAKYGTVTTSAIKGAIDGAAGGMTSAFVLDITNAHLWDKGLYEGMARVVADTFTGALYGMGGGLLAGGGTAAAMKGGRVIASVGASAEEGLGSVTSMRERTQPHPEAARITEALHDALPMHIREEMLAAVDVHVLESGPEADAFLATTGSHSGEACIWTDGEQIVVFARPDATVEDIAHEAGHLEQLFSASKGPLVRELYDAVPDLATWEALGEAGLYAEQLRLYKLKLGLEIDLHETQRAARQAAGDVEGVLEAEQTLAELRGLQQRAEAVTAEELAAGPVKLLDEGTPWLFTGEGERLAKGGAVRERGFAPKKTVEQSAQTDIKGSASREISTAVDTSVTYGNNAQVKMRKHSQHMRETAREFGVQIPTGPSTPATQSAMKNWIGTVVGQGETKTGQYMTFEGAIWSRLGDGIVIRRSNGEFLTYLDYRKGGVAHGWDNLK